MQHRKPDMRRGGQRGVSAPWKLGLRWRDGSGMEGGGAVGGEQRQGQKIPTAGGGSLCGGRLGGITDASAMDACVCLPGAAAHGAGAGGIADGGTSPRRPDLKQGGEEQGDGASPVHSGVRRCWGKVRSIAGECEWGSGAARLGRGNRLEACVTMGGGRLESLRHAAPGAGLREVVLGWVTFLLFRGRTCRATRGCCSLRSWRCRSGGGR